MAVRDRMLAFIDRMATTGVASPGRLQGCTPDEVLFLERKYGVRLPESYALFLGSMGHGAGRLVSRGEFDFYYPDVLRLTEEERQFWAEVRADDMTAAAVELPPQALIICGRHGEQFTVMDCTRPDDSPTFYFNHWDKQMRQTHDSLFGFLESMRADAEHWIGRGHRERSSGWTH
jgi:hypothetical protein